MPIQNERLMRHVDFLVTRYPALKNIEKEIIKAYYLMQECYENDGKVLVAGNGGSAADAEHIVGELMKCFKIPRPISQEFSEKLKEVDKIRGEYLAKHLECALPAISLTNHEALTTAYINDVGAEGMFAQQLFGLGKTGDVFFAISTSGNSKNVVNAAIVAKALGIKVIGLTGAEGGKLLEFADIVIRVPAQETFMIQELHLPIYHCLCLMLEENFFNNEYLK